MSNEHIIRNIVFVAGPGSTAFDKNDIEKAVNNFKLAGANVTLVGDGESDISLETIKEAIASQNGPVTVIVNTHGKLNYNNKGALILGKEEPLVIDFIKQTQEAGKDNHIDYFIISCSVGETILNSIDPKLLKNGSVLVTLSSGGLGKSTVFSDLKRFYDSIPYNKYSQNNGFGADKLLYDYLTSDLENRISPNVIIGNNKGYDLQYIFKENILTHKQYTVQETFKSCYNPSSQEIANKLNDIKSEYDILAKDYGMALAIAFHSIDPLFDKQISCEPAGLSCDPSSQDF